MVRQSDNESTIIYVIKCISQMFVLLCVFVLCVCMGWLSVRPRGRFEMKQVRLRWEEWQKIIRDEAGGDYTSPVSSFMVACIQSIHGFISVQEYQ